MKQLFTLSVVFIFLIPNLLCQADGSIVFLDYNADGSGQTIQFLLLADMAEGAEINFTDHGWFSAGGFRDNEGVITWTSPVGGANCGSVQSVTESGSFQLAAGGDQIIAFTGTVASPTVIAAIQMNGAWDSDATNANTSAAPGSSSDFFISPERDNAAYTGTTTGTVASIKAAVLDASNWTTSNDVNQAFSGSFTISDCGAIAPVKLGEIDVVQIEETVSFSWATISESNSSHFEIQRSIDGRVFEQIGNVMSYGTTLDEQNYNFIDAAPHKGINYYRFKQIDFDGQFEYSPLVSVLVRLEEGNTKAEVYPNPSNGAFSITWFNDQEAELQVYDMSGKQLISIQLNGGAKVYALDLSYLPTGVYNLVVQSDGNIQNERIVIE